MELIYDKNLIYQGALLLFALIKNLKKSTRQVKQDARSLFHILVGQRTFLHCVSHLCLVHIIIFPIIYFFVNASKLFVIGQSIDLTLWDLILTC